MIIRISGNDEAVKEKVAAAIEGLLKELGIKAGVQVMKPRVFTVADAEKDLFDSLRASGKVDPVTYKANLGGSMLTPIEDVAKQIDMPAEEIRQFFLQGLSGFAELGVSQWGIMVLKKIQELRSGA